MSTTIQFDIWGSRGSRNLQASRSAIATLTACYSLVDGEDLIVLDAGHGLGSLAWALDSRPVFQEVRRVHVFVSHPHMDHWEGLKDAEWFWVPNGRELRLFGNAETLHAIRVAYAHPNFVALEILSQNHLIGFSEQVMTPDQDVRIGRFTVRGVGLHHYSGDSDRPRPVPTLGFRVWLEGGPGIAYLSDHEPRPETREIERQLLEGAHLAVFDANFPDRAQQNHGHGSQEFAVSVARERPGTLVLAGHLGSSLSDAELQEGRQRHAADLPNYDLAVEGTSYLWSAEKGLFVKGPRQDPAAVARSKARHDLRTPINQIIGYSEMLAEIAEEEGLPHFVKDLNKIRTAARNELDLIALHLAEPGTQAPTASPGRVAAAPESQADPSAAAVPAAKTAGSSTEAHPAVESDVVQAAWTKEPDAASSPSGNGRLLVVDDEPMNRDMLARRLETKGFSVAVAEDGRSALDRVAAERFDLILLDVMMPGISGLDVLRRLRQTHNSSALPIIMATALGASEDIVQALSLGANDYVTKPLDFPVVMARVNAQLALKRQKEEIEQLAADLEVRNRFIQNTFGRYLSDQVVSSLLESPEGLKLGGESRKVSILMSDLRGFTAVSERLGPEQVIRMLNMYLGAMADVIFEHQGTIDEFIGDAILALFGAPISREDDARRAVACALSMQVAMEDVNRLLLAEGLPAIEMGIAVHTGEVVVGNIGSQRRTKYGIVGPPVNMTGRMESYTVGGQILVSEATVKEAGPILKLGQPILVKAKGSHEPMLVYDLQGIGGGFDLFLSRRDEVLHPLPDAVRIRFTILEGKRVGDDVFEGTFTRLSPCGAEVCSAHPVRALSNLQIRVRDEHGEDVPGDLYAKVLESDGAKNDSILVRFTSIPPTVEAFFRRVLPDS